MTRVVFIVSFVLALIAGGACVGTVGDAQGTSTGTAGANATAGTTGTAGTNAIAGTTGTAGTNDAAGTTGTGGSIVTTGGCRHDRNSGTRRHDGHGRFDRRHDRNSGARRHDGHGRFDRRRRGPRRDHGHRGRRRRDRRRWMTSCTITATSTMGTIPTVGIVTFTTSATSPTAAEIRFGLASTGPTMTAPVDLTKAMYRTLLLGMKGSSSYVYRIVVTSSAGTCTSQDYTFMTGAVPSSVPKPTVDDPERHGARQGVRRHQQRPQRNRRVHLRFRRRAGLVGDGTQRRQPDPDELGRQQDVHDGAQRPELGWLGQDRRHGRQQRHHGVGADHGASRHDGDSGRLRNDALDHDGDGRALLAGRTIRRRNDEDDHRQHEHRLQLEHVPLQLDPLLPVRQHVHGGRSEPELVREGLAHGAADLAARRQQSEGREQILLGHRDLVGEPRPPPDSRTERSTCSTTVRAGARPSADSS